jgi:hypothetical protein
MSGANEVDEGEFKVCGRLLKKSLDSGIFISQSWG